MILKEKKQSIAGEAIGICLALESEASVPELLEEKVVQLE
jgi:hypothetical protein